MFIYSSYWGTWSRVLSERHPNGPFVEVNLTPIPHCHSSEWQNDVAPIKIRFHGTYNRSDKVVNELPAPIREEMVKNLGEELTNRLLTEDFLSHIDIELYHKFNNGGADFEKIRRK